MTGSGVGVSRFGWCSFRGAGILDVETVAFLALHVVSLSLMGDYFATGW